MRRLMDLVGSEEASRIRRARCLSVYVGIVTARSFEITYKVSNGNRCAYNLALTEMCEAIIILSFTS